MTACEKSKASVWRVSGALMLGACGFVQSSLPLAAQTGTTANNPAVVIDQQNQQRLKQLSSVPLDSGPVVISPQVARGEIVAPGGPTLVLKSVQFAPASAFLSQAELDKILADYLGKSVDFSQIQRLVQAVNDLYAQKGVVTASAVLPPQTLNRGVLKVQLVEGKLASLGLSGTKTVPDQFVLSRIRLTKGDDIVDVPQAATDITRFNKVYSAQLRLSLEPGAKFGTTNLALALSEPQKNQLSFFLDNQGAASTGASQAGVFFHSYSLLATEDNLFAYGTLSEGSSSGTLAYDLPITASGARLSLSFSRSVIDVVSGPTKSLNISGSSTSVSAALSHPVYVSPTWALIANLGGARGSSKSFSNATALVDSQSTKSWLGLDASYTAQNFAVAISPKVSFVQAQDHLAASTRAITLFSGSFNATYKFAGGLDLTANGAWQKTRTKLLPGDLLFQIGGPATLRGYPSDSAGGDSGYFAQFELHNLIKINAAKGADIFGFVDTGAVYSTFPSKVVLVSAGAGLSYPVFQKAKFDIGLGLPLRDVIANQDKSQLFARLSLAAF